MNQYPSNQYLKSILYDDDFARMVSLEAVRVMANELLKSRTSASSQCAPDGWKMVPVEPTERMVINGFESQHDEDFSEPTVWEKYTQMSGCQQAAYKAQRCWAAMLAAAPAPGG